MAARSRAAHRPSEDSPALGHDAECVLHAAAAPAEAVVVDPPGVGLWSGEGCPRVGAHQVALQWERLVAHQVVGQVDVGVGQRPRSWQDVASLHLPSEQGGQVRVGKDAAVTLAAEAANAELSEPEKSS